MENVYACMKLVRVETFSSIVWVAFICPYQYLVESLHHNYDTDDYIINFTDNQNHNERDVSRENINWKKFQEPNRVPQKLLSLSDTGID